MDDDGLLAIMFAIIGAFTGFVIAMAIFLHPEAGFDGACHYAGGTVQGTVCIQDKVVLFTNDQYDEAVQGR